MEQFDISLLEKALKETKSVKQPESIQFIEAAPPGITEDFFDKFIRVFSAKDPAEVADITDDELIQMRYRMHEVFRYISDEPFFNRNLFKRIESKKSVKTTKRVL